MRPVTFEDTEAQRRAQRALAEYRNHVIDWCVSVITGHVAVAGDLGDDQLTTIVELLQKEKTVA